MNVLLCTNLNQTGPPNWVLVDLVGFYCSSPADGLRVLFRMVPDCQPFDPENIAPMAIRRLDVDKCSFLRLTSWPVTETNELYCAIWNTVLGLPNNILKLGTDGSTTSALTLRDQLSAIGPGRYVPIQDVRTDAPLSQGWQRLLPLDFFQAYRPDSLLFRAIDHIMLARVGPRPQLDGCTRLEGAYYRVITVTNGERAVNLEPLFNYIECRIATGSHHALGFDSAMAVHVLRAAVGRYEMEKFI